MSVHFLKFCDTDGFYLAPKKMLEFGTDNWHLLYFYNKDPQFVTERKGANWNIGFLISKGPNSPEHFAGPQFAQNHNINLHGYPQNKSAVLLNAL